MNVPSQNHWTALIGQKWVTYPVFCQGGPY
jgi:hypothetical protein